MKIKPCPFCGSKDLYVRDNSGHYVACKNCDAYGPYGKDDEEAIRLWNHAPRKEDAKMEKNCANCVHISEEVDGKVYCCEKIDIDHSCKYWEALNPFGNSCSTCVNCKHRYYSWGKDEVCNYCGHEIGNPEGYVCDSWEAKEPEPAPLNSEDSSGLNSFIPGAIEALEYVRREESLYNRMQQLAEEAAELAQAVLKYNRLCDGRCYTPMSPKDANDAIVEEMADVLLCMEAAFPHCPGNMDFYSNLARVYREKAERWAERLKEHDD